MAALRSGTIAAVYNLTDTIYFFRVDGSPTAQRPLRLRYYRPLESAPPRGPIGPALQKWANSFTQVHRPFWLDDGSIAISYFDQSDFDLFWRLAMIDAEGRLLFDERDTPELLTTGATRTMIFVSSESSAPNLWTYAEVSRDR